jgi:hypothetical protein
LADQDILLAVARAATVAGGDPRADWTARLFKAADTCLPVRVSTNKAAGS